MKNNYIYVEQNDHNELRTKMDIDFGFMQIKPFVDVDVKIDTGCPYTTILTRRLNISEAKSLYYKKKDCSDASIAKQVSFGVNDSTQTKDKYIQMFKSGNLFSIPAISFVHKCDGLRLCGVDIDCKEVKVNYDRVGNILVGMDIIGQMDNHIGTSKKTGKVTLLACPKDRLSEDYYLALKEHFALGTEISKNNDAKNFEKS